MTSCKNFYNRIVERMTDARLARRLVIPNVSFHSGEGGYGCSAIEAGRPRQARSTRERGSAGLVMVR